MQAAAIREPSPELSQLAADFCRELASAGFSGDIQQDRGARIAVSTDNSVYQVQPQAVVFPRHHADVERVLRLVHLARFRALHIMPRGGGTGTNGQSLGDGIMLDCSRYMTAIGDIDLQAATVQVQPGVVLDRLNTTLALHHHCFAPTVSTASRATIGGMIATDASGKGSRIYGKTSEHVLSATVVHPDGSSGELRPFTRAEIDAMRSRGDTHATMMCALADLVHAHADTFNHRVPHMQRFVTGYNLAHARLPDGRFNPIPLYCGAEGSLGVITGCTLRMTPKPLATRVVAVLYRDFAEVVDDAQRLLAHDPLAIECADEHVLQQARHDSIWQTVGAFLQVPADGPCAINIVEFSGSPEEVSAASDRLEAELQNGHPTAISWYATDQTDEIAALWELRKKGVGLLGAMTVGRRRPIAFVEDCGVPPEHLGAFLRAFRELLEREDLRYGIFGHVDVGVLHVRPALDTTDPDDADRLRSISDAVDELVRAHGGVIWAEHGKGYRGEYATRVFGEELFQVMRAIKTACDPHDLCNRGKIATSTTRDLPLIPLDGVPLRGEIDRTVDDSQRADWSSALACNGNGACHDWHPDHVMCPSTKIREDHLHSPKGRADMLRAWLHRSAEHGVDRSGEPPNSHRHRDDFDEEVFAALDGCLSCKACSTRCPIQVDIPAMKSRFLAWYYGSRRRPLRDALVARVETLLLYAATAPRFSNVMLRLGSGLSRKLLGLIDAPPVSVRSLFDHALEHGFPPMDAPPQRQGDKPHIVLWPDVFTAVVQPAIITDAACLLQRAGARVAIAEPRPSGKPAHIKGDWQRFQRIARERDAELQAWVQAGWQPVGIDPAIAQVAQDEYRRDAGCTGPAIGLVQHVLAEGITDGSLRLPRVADHASVQLLGHCSERAADDANMTAWRTTFAATGIDCTTPPVGCCGMAGTFGHEAHHEAESKGLYDLSWRAKIDAGQKAGAITCATGFSCRHQAHRCHDQELAHPISVLWEAVAQVPSQRSGDPKGP